MIITQPMLDDLSEKELLQLEKLFGDELEKRKLLNQGDEKINDRTD